MDYISISYTELKKQSRKDYWRGVRVTVLLVVIPIVASYVIFANNIIRLSQ